MSSQLEQDLYGLVLSQCRSYASMATPIISTYVGDEILKLIVDSGEYIKIEDIVDDATSQLIDRLVVQNKSLEKLAEKASALDFVTLDRDMWQKRCLDAERVSENLSQQLAREVK